MRRKLSLVAVVLLASIAGACTNPVAPSEMDPCCIPPKPPPELEK